MIELSNQTRSLGKNGQPITAPNLPQCEIYGQMSISPAPQIKTKLVQRQRKLFENVERHVEKDNFSQKLVYLASSGDRFGLIFLSIMNLATYNN